MERVYGVEGRLEGETSMLICCWEKPIKWERSRWQESHSGGGRGKGAGHSGSSGLPQGESPSITEEEEEAQGGQGGAGRECDVSFQGAKGPGRSPLSGRRRSIGR